MRNLPTRDTTQASIGVPTAPEIPSLVNDIGGSLVSLENSLADLAALLAPVTANSKEGANENSRPYPATSTDMGAALLEKVVTIDGLRDRVNSLCARVRL